MLAWVACAVTAATAQAETTASPARDPSTPAVDMDDALSLPAGFVDSLAPHFRSRPRARPDWWREYSDDELPFEEPVLERDAMHLVLQEDRPDGPDFLLTLRYPFMALGALDVYAGAGLGQVVYLAENGVGPILLFGRSERHRSVRPAAELGTELRFSDAAFVNFDLHWLDLNDEASLLRTETGMIDASSWATRITVGWRFR
jgi:hypothetical protein